MVYTAESRSLAALEVLVHLEGPARGYSVIRCEIPDDVAIEELADGDLPDGWRGSPASAARAAIGDAWVARGTSAVLKVPSAVVDGEYNYLLNLRHSSFQRISIHLAEPFPYDERLVALVENRNP
jgi:RES domain-containing protein